jgi:hypothetical protein
MSSLRCECGGTIVCADGSVWCDRCTPVVTVKVPRGGVFGLSPLVGEAQGVKAEAPAPSGNQDPSASAPISRREAEQQAEIARLREDYDRVHRLPEQEWASVCAVILQVLAAAARAGFQVKDTGAVKAMDRGQVYVTRLRAAKDAAEQQLAALRKDIDRFWDYVENGWDIEPRAFFETESRDNGFDSPLAQAAHHIWKRDPKVAALTSALVEYGQHKPGCNADRCMRCGCSVRPNNQHLVWIGDRPSMQHAAQLGKCTCGFSALTAEKDPQKTRNEI